MLMCTMCTFNGPSCAFKSVSHQQKPLGAILILVRTMECAQKLMTAILAHVSQASLGITVKAVKHKDLVYVEFLSLLKK